MQEAARQHGLTVAEVEQWRERFLLGAENALRSRPREEEALKEEEIKRLKQKVGERVMDNDVLKAAIELKVLPSPLFLKEECVWQHQFSSFAAARSEVAASIRWYNRERPHQALGYRSPMQ